MKLRKIASLFVVLGLAVGLLGAGVSASFTDSATATTTIHVGTFDISLSSPTNGAVVSCPVGFDNCTVTFDAGTINSSAAGSKAFAVIVNNIGTIPATIHVVAAGPAAPFTDLLGAVADFPLAAGASHQLDAGLGWPELQNAQLGLSYSITYTITASA